MAARLKSLRSYVSGVGNVATAFLVGAALTKIYYETSDTVNGKSSIQKQIQEIVAKHDNLKHGSHLRVINPPRVGKSVDELDSIVEDNIFKYGLPKRSPEYLRFKNHVLCYDQAKKTPRWVLEHLTKEKIKGEADRVHSVFKPDPNVPALFQSSNDDYWDSGWSRGHMAPASNSKYNQDAMDATFLLSNIVPQDLDNNAIFWYRLEAYCRSLTKRYSNVYIVSGPLYLPKEQDGKKIVTYEVIGANDVAVPTHLYKVILAEDNDKEAVLGAFVVPNKPINFEYKLQDFQVSLGDLEKYSGLAFFPFFDAHKANDLCVSDGCKLLSKERMELISFGRRLRNSSSSERLEMVWEEMKQNGVIPDSYLIDIYEKRKRALMQEDRKSVRDI